MVAAGSKYMDMHVDLMSWNSTQHTITVLSVPVKASMTRLHFCVCFQAYFLNICLVDYLHPLLLHKPTAGQRPYWVATGGTWYMPRYAAYTRLHTQSPTVQHLICRSFLQCEYVWFRGRAYASLPSVKSTNRKWSWNCMQLDGYRSLPCKWCLINVILINQSPVNVQILYLRMASVKNCLDFQIPTQTLCHKKRCIRLFRTWHDTKYYSTPKKVFMNTNVGMDFNVHTLSWDPCVCTFSKRGLWLLLSALSSSEVSIPRDPWAGDRSKERERKCERRRKGRKETGLCKEVKIKDRPSSRWKAGELQYDAYPANKNMF